MKTEVSKSELIVCLAVCFSLLVASLVTNYCTIEILQAERGTLASTETSEARFRTRYLLWRAHSYEWKNDYIRVINRNEKLLRENDECWNQIRWLTQRRPRS